MDATDAARLLAGGAMLLDVREAGEWAAGHVPGARHMPLRVLPDLVAHLPRDRKIVVVCRSGRRSAHGTTLLRRAGLDAVNLRGGMQAWAAAGLAVETNVGVPGVVA